MSISVIPSLSKCILKYHVNFTKLDDEIYIPSIRFDSFRVRLVFGLDYSTRDWKMGRFNEILKEYMANSSLHGVRFIIDEKIHFVERMFWLICVIISWIASALLILSAIDAFQHNAISFVVETSFRDWNTHFPAVVVCEAKNTDRVQEMADRYRPESNFKFICRIANNNLTLDCLVFGVLITILRSKRCSQRSHSSVVSLITQFANVARQTMKTTKLTKRKKVHFAFAPISLATRKWFAAGARVMTNLTISCSIFAERKRLISWDSVLLVRTRRHGRFLQLEWWTVQLLRVLSANANRIGHMLCFELDACGQVNAVLTWNVSQMQSFICSCCSYANTPKMNMISNKFTGPGSLTMEVMTEANIYSIGEEDVPNLVTSKAEILSVGPYISYT